MISDEQWGMVLEKYTKLFSYISHRIGGDGITNDYNDSFQDLSIACLDAIVAYRKKTCTKFEDFFHTDGFDKYLKTVLWNCKNNRGSTIMKKKTINNKVTLEEELIDGEMCHYDTSTVPFEDLNLDLDSSKIVNTIHKNPKLIKPNGSINLNALSKELGEDKSRVKLYISQLENKLNDYREE